MNLRGNDRLRMLLMGAVAVGVLGPQVVRSAGPAAALPNRAPAVARPAAPPRLLPSTTPEAVVLPVVNKTEPAKKSEVMKQLELLYQQDGREMPDMNTDIKPVPVDPPENGTAKPASPPPSSNGLRTQQPATAQSAAAPAAPAPIAPVESKPKNPVVAFFKRLVPGHKESKPTKAPAEYRPDVAPVPPTTGPAQPLITGQPAVQNRVANSGSAALPILDAQPRAPFTAPETAPDPLPKPLADVGDVPPSPSGDLPLPAQTALIPPLFNEPTTNKPAILPETADKTATEPSSPFTELSEAEADKKLDLNPFTGLTLDENAGSASKPSSAPSKSEDPAPASAIDPSDPFADELKKLTSAPPAKEATTPKLEAPVSQSPTFDGIEDEATREKMKKIHERGGMKGLKGFCPVTLRDQRELVDAKPDFHSTFRGQKFHFADADAKIKFDEEPARYAPAAYGADVVALTRDKDVVEGSLDFAAWFKGRLYLFGNQDAHDTFVANPSLYATPVGIE